MSPPKQKRRLCGTALQIAELIGAYHLARFLAMTFERPYWVLEQWRGKLADRLSNEGFEV